ncbi:MAG: acetyl-CoA C-acetyltransferase [Candidatus Thermoplasmatota archaeon]|nr:acetyl-CoA C-acetyltransferase [Candidatus Thermoplasmatota archaeon]
MSEDRESFLVYYKRSAFSRSRPSEPERDKFNGIRMDEALSMLIKDAVKSTGTGADKIDDVIVGCALQADENWTYGGRHPVLLSNLSVHIPAMAVDRACSSSLNAAAIGSMEVATGNSDFVLAGGMEHMTHVPLNGNPHIKPNIKLLVRPEYARLDMNTGYNMGLTAEKLADLKHIERDEMDEFALRSHMEASRAEKTGWLGEEILPLKVESGNEMVTVDRDQSIRHDANIEQMKKLQPAFKPGGRITAGNSSPLNAGASLVGIMSGKMVKETGIKPLARIMGFGWAAVDPSIMGEGPVPATKKALKHVGIGADDVDLWEINEAFAVVALNAMKEFNIPLDRVNVNGGAIAIGHPLGASGARLLGTLARSLHQKKKDVGAATLCVGGGQGFTMLIERV